MKQAKRIAPRVPQAASTTPLVPKVASCAARVSLPTHQVHPCAGSATLTRMHQRKALCHALLVHQAQPQASREPWMWKLASVRVSCGTECAWCAPGTHGSRMGNASAVPGDWFVMEAKSPCLLRDFGLQPITPSASISASPMNIVPAGYQGSVTEDELGHHVRTVRLDSLGKQTFVPTAPRSAWQDGSSQALWLHLAFQRPTIS